MQGSAISLKHSALQLASGARQKTSQRKCGTGMTSSTGVGQHLMALLVDSREISLVSPTEIPGLHKLWSAEERESDVGFETGKTLAQRGLMNPQKLPTARTSSVAFSFASHSGGAAQQLQRRVIETTLNENGAEPLHRSQPSHPCKSWRWSSPETPRCTISLRVCLFSSWAWHPICLRRLSHFTGRARSRVRLPPVPLFTLRLTIAGYVGQITWPCLLALAPALANRASVSGDRHRHQHRNHSVCPRPLVDLLVCVGTCF